MMVQTCNFFWRALMVLLIPGLAICTVPDSPNHHHQTVVDEILNLAIQEPNFSLYTVGQLLQKIPVVPQEILKSSEVDQLLSVLCTLPANNLDILKPLPASVAALEISCTPGFLPIEFSRDDSTSAKENAIEEFAVLDHKSNPSSQLVSLTPFKGDKNQLNEATMVKIRYNGVTHAVQVQYDGSIFSSYLIK